MSRRNILQGTIGLVIVVCGLLFSLSFAGTTHAATRASAAPQLCGSNIAWYYVTSDTKDPVYTYNYPRVGQVHLTLQVQVVLEAEFGDNGYCGFMRSELTVTEHACSTSYAPACGVDGTAQVYFVNTSGQQVCSNSASREVGSSGSIDIPTCAVPAKAGAAGGYLAVSGNPTVYVATAQEPY